jgi:hypothetical protein
MALTLGALETCVRALETHEPSYLGKVHLGPRVGFGGLITNN